MDDSQARITFMIAEFQALREEVLVYIRQRMTLLSLNLVAAGALLPIGISEQNSLILLLQPFISFLLATRWAYDNAFIVRLGLYIQSQIEAEISSGWETYQVRVYGDSPFNFPYDLLGLASSGGIFLSTQIVSMILIWDIGTSGNIEQVLQVAGYSAIVYTCVLIAYVGSLKRRLPQRAITK